MFDGKLIQRAAVTGIVLQIAMIVIGHYIAWVRANAWEFGGMMISGLAGLFYARDFAKGYAKGALGGAIVGGTAGLIAVCVANILQDEPLIAIGAQFVHQVQQQLAVLGEQGRREERHRRPHR